MRSLFPHILINTAITGFTNMLLGFGITFSVKILGILGEELVNE